MRKQLLFALATGIAIILFAGSCSKAKEDKLASQTPVDSTGCDTVNMKYSTDVVAIMVARCYTCHGNNSTGGSGGINLNSYANLKLYADNGVLAGSITHAPGFVGMPYNAPKMDDCSINTILDWINRGAPNN